MGMAFINVTENQYINFNEKIHNNSPTKKPIQSNMCATEGLQMISESKSLILKKHLINNRFYRKLAYTCVNVFLCSNNIYMNPNYVIMFSEKGPEWRSEIYI